MSPSVEERHAGLRKSGDSITVDAAVWFTVMEMTLHLQDELGTQFNVDT